MTKHSMYNSGNRDANEKEIIDILKARNVRCTQMRPGDGFDLLIWIAPPEYWEIKNPDQPASKRELTDSELDAAIYAREAGIEYRVIETPEQALERLNNYFAGAR